MNVGEIVSQAIKENKWIVIEYLNKENELTNYWISVIDVLPKERKLTVNIFNHTKSYESFSTDIKFDKIQSAKIIEFSNYDVSPDLIDRIENNPKDYEWLNYDKFNHNILNYYNECSYLDNDPSQNGSFLISGVDNKILRKNKKYNLNDEQLKLIIDKIYVYDLKKKKDCKYDMCINVVSIDQGNTKYVMCYYDLLFDPKEKCLKVSKELKFNKSFLVEGRKHSLFNYVNMDLEEFIENFQSNYAEYREMVCSSLRHGEYYNERPEIFILEREYSINLASTYDEITRRYTENDLNTPLKSFFGNISKRNNIRRKEPFITIYNKQININQMRVIYNALKYPVTYVQGPPGTGKTQTILNVLLSAFFDDKSVLTCSSNNKPVDGIIEKLKFKYRNENVWFPYLRLGNFSETIQATKRIREIYEFKTDKVVKENLINQIKENETKAIEKLVQLLGIQEERVKLEDYLESLKKLLSSMSKHNNIYENLLTRKTQIEDDLSNLPIITNEEVLELFIPITEDSKLMQFLYFKSLSYVNKLKEPKYRELIEICYIEDDDERGRKFNKWLQRDENMKLLNNAFPIIFTTNISAARLGTPQYKFDLVIMDEAGQCNVAHALIPIVKAESLLLVGDPNQLKPVVILEDSVNEKLKEKYNVQELYDYKKYSILDVMLNHDNISKYILLKYHYRCGKKIIKFSNDRYYGSSLDLSTIAKDGELEFLNVKNTNINEKNSALEEAVEIIKYIKRNNISDVYIITPFVNQQNLINKLLAENNMSNIKCGTIHSLQGAEMDTIILSTALSHKTSQQTYKWMKNNFELINVGVTRAKSKLVISGDMDALNALSDKKDDLYALFDYAKADGKVLVPPNETFMIQIGKSNGSKNEDEFYKTVAHFCSVHSTYSVKRNVPFSKFFKNVPELAASNMEFDFVISVKNGFKTTPEIVVELCGGEHLGTAARERCDNLKMKICKQRGIKFFMIDNSFIKSYEYIKDLIIGSANKSSVRKTLFEIEEE